MFTPWGNDFLFSYVTKNKWKFLIISINTLSSFLQKAYKRFYDRFNCLGRNNVFKKCVRIYYDTQMKSEKNTLFYENESEIIMFFYNLSSAFVNRFRPTYRQPIFKRFLNLTFWFFLLLKHWFKNPTHTPFTIFQNFVHPTLFWSQSACEHSKRLKISI